MTQSIFFGLELSSKQEYKEILTLTRIAEELGFDAIFYGMDDLTMRDLDCWTMLAALAAETERIRLGPMMSFFTHRHPSALAKAITTLDGITNGRIEWRVAPGDPEMVKAWQQHGVNVRPVRESIDLLEEGLTIFKQLCGARQPVTFQGKFFRLQGVTLVPQPVQQPYPPITIPASGWRMLGVVAKHAQIWIGSEYFLNPEMFEVKQEQLQRICMETGRDFQEITPSIELLVFIDDDGDAARQQAELFRKNANLPDDFLAHHAIGTPVDCIQVIKNWQGRGVRRFDLWFEQSKAKTHEIRLFGEQVIPHFEVDA